MNFVSTRFIDYNDVLATERKKTERIYYAYRLVCAYQMKRERIWIHLVYETGTKNLRKTKRVHVGIDIQ